MPAKVDELFDEVKKSNPSYSDEQAWATAWSIYCKHVEPGSESCHLPTSEYLKGKTAASAEYEQATEAHSKALKEYEAAVKAYRAGKIDDAKFLAARAEKAKADRHSIKPLRPKQPEKRLTVTMTLIRRSTSRCCYLRANPPLNV